MLNKLGSTVIISFVLSLFIISLAGALPHEMNYQGYLTDSNEIPLDGDYLMSFALYDVQEGGSSVWAESQTVNIENGIYNVILGQPSNELAPALFQTDLYLGVAVGLDPEMEPRLKLTTTPFSMKSGQAYDSDMLGGQVPTDFDQSAHLGNTDNPHGVTTTQISAVETSAYATHTGDASAHHAKTTSFTELTDTASEAQIPDEITRDTELGTGLDGKADTSHTHETVYYTQSQVNTIVSNLQSQLDALNTLFANVTRTGNDITFSGVNVHIVSGSGTTDGTVNGLGNLVVGYNEERTSGNDKTGSHNIVIGSMHNYSSYGGLVAGHNNSISGQYAAVSGGRNNIAAGYASSITGGGGPESFNGNIAFADFSAILGGEANLTGDGTCSFDLTNDDYTCTPGSDTAVGLQSTVSGGNGNIASGETSSVSGGLKNKATGVTSSISGGRSNTASNYQSSVSGGYNNTASSYQSSVSGGYYNRADGATSSVSGGANNIAEGSISSVSGGDNNTASGVRSSVSGGANNLTPGKYSSVSGGRYNLSSGESSSVTGGGGATVASGNEAYGHYTTVLGGQSNLTGDPAKLDHELGQLSTVAGGFQNIASGLAASVSGGQLNVAEGAESAVSGGHSNTASGSHSSISGGGFNLASGDYSSVTGGGGANVASRNEAFGHYTTVLGGQSNLAGDPAKSDHNIGQLSTVAGGFQNIANGLAASVGGGRDNHAQGPESAVSGGYYNKASGQYSTVGGGRANSAVGPESAVSGGFNNTASGQYSTVGGGYFDSVTGIYDWRAGNTYFATD